MSLLLSDDDMFGIVTDQAESSRSSCHKPTSGCNNTVDRLKVNDELGPSHKLQHEVPDDDEKLVDEVSSATSSSGESSYNGAPVTGTEPCDTVTIRQHGIPSFHFALRIDVASHIRIEVTDDNADIVRTLQECKTLLVNRYLPTVKRWLEVNGCHVYVLVNIVAKFHHQSHTL